MTTQKKYDKLVTHPVQSWLWGQFQKSQGHDIVRFKNFTVSFHQIPKTNFTVGTVLRGPKLSKKDLDSVYAEAKKRNSIFVKFEPNTLLSNSRGSQLRSSGVKLVKSPKEAFYPHSYIIDLTKSEDELLASQHPKTRYNIKVAQKHGVVIKDMTTDQGFKIYLDLIFNTTKRQGFYLHSKKYHQDLWSLLKKSGMVHILVAFYQNKPLGAFMFLKWHKTWYYPYGGTSYEHRNVQAPTLLMWQAILLGKKLGCTSFDMWGSLGPDAKPTDNGYGFHRFKKGFGGKLVEFTGTYDLVINPLMYRLYNLVDKLRWVLLRLKAKLPF